MSSKKKIKVVILLAGMGSRLGRPHPKSLTPLENGETILSRQLRILSGFDLSVCAVVGFKKDIIMEAAPDVLFAYNTNYDTTNTSKSLLCALNHIHHSDVLWLNGDVVFDPEIIELMLEAKTSAVAVNNARTSDEEIKYTLNDNGYINTISKQVKNALGEALGINLIKAEHLELFKHKLELVDDNDYFERGMELLIDDMRDVFKPIDIGDRNCVEVDFEDDLSLAREMVKDDSYSK